MKTIISPISDAPSPPKIGVPGAALVTESRGNRRRQLPILKRSVMRGIITTKDLVTCAPTIISEFGMAAYLRCWARALTSRREVTFLECVCRMRRSNP
jgi:hypothetical protein